MSTHTNNQVNEDNVYVILSANMNWVNKKLATMRRRFERNGFDFTYEVLGTEYHDVNIQDDPWLKPILRPAEFTRIYVDGHAVYNGWEFVAKVEATDEGNIITGPPNSRTVPEHYRTDKLVCDHCDHNRKRKHGFIVREPISGDYRMVGRTCLALYTGGLNPADVTYFASLFDELLTWNNNASLAPKANRVILATPVEVVAHALATVEHQGGYYSYDRATRSDKTPTGVQTRNFVYASLGVGVNAKRTRTYMDDNHIDPVSYIDEAEELVTWIKSQDTTDNDFLHNLSVLAHHEYIDVSTKTSLMASVIAARNYAERCSGREDKSQDNTSTSSFQGQPGQRHTFVVESANVITTWENDYGDLVKMWKVTDAEDNVFIWKTSSAKDIVDGVEVTATVKEHSTYEGMGQTVITRPKIG